MNNSQRIMRERHFEQFLDLIRDEFSKLLDEISQNEATIENLDEFEIKKLKDEVEELQNEINENEETIKDLKDEIKLLNDDLDSKY